MNGLPCWCSGPQQLQPQGRAGQHPEDGERDAHAAGQPGRPGRRDQPGRGDGQQHQGDHDGQPGLEQHLLGGEQLCRGHQAQHDAAGQHPAPPGGQVVDGTIMSGISAVSARLRCPRPAASTAGENPNASAPGGRRPVPGGEPAHERERAHRPGREARDERHVVGGQRAGQQGDRGHQQGREEQRGVPHAVDAGRRVHRG